MIGFGLFLISGSCLLHYQSWFLQSGHFNISGTGGIIGEFIGEKLTGMTTDYIVVELAKQNFGEHWLDEITHRVSQGGMEKVLL